MTDNENLDSALNSLKQARHLLATDGASKSLVSSYITEAIMQLLWVRTGQNEDV